MMGRMSNALIVIDVQNEYFTGSLPIVHPDRDDSLANIVAAMRAAVANGTKVIVVQHAEDAESEVFRPGTDGQELHPAVASEHRDALVVKHYPGSFTGTDMGSLLADWQVDHVTICGFMTHMCCDTTARQAAHRDLRVTLLADATGTIDLARQSGDPVPARQVHETELAVLGSGFATISSTAEWTSGLAVAPDAAPA